MINANSFVTHISLFIAHCSLLIATTGFPSTPIKILLITGQNNHEWQETTPLLKQIYEQSGYFIVDVTTSPESYDKETLAPYDVIVSNWTAWPDVTGRQWGAKMEDAFLDFIRQGKGFALFHAASATLHDWPEYQQIVGATWNIQKTGHGPIHEFKVSVKDYGHPVTAGMTDFWIRDELWHRTEQQSGIHTLCSAYSSSVAKGSLQFEPVVITTQFGEGRCFYNVLGHNAETMKNKAWQALMLRGTEWAATKQVTIPVPLDWPCTPKEYETGNNLTWYEDEESAGLLNNGRFVWQFFCDSVSKPWFDLNLTDGSSLTWKSPPDHTWHHALWFCWKFINELNYWEEKDGVSEGLTSVIAQKFDLEENGSAEIEVELSYHPPGKASLLKENRTMLMSRPDTAGHYYIDWTSRFTAQDQKVVLERTPIEGQPGGRAWGGYATLALRMNTRTLSQVELTDSEGRKNLDIHTKPTRWVDISGQLRSDTTRQAGIAIFDHPDNPRHPPPGYVINDAVEKHDLQFTYTNPGFLYREGLTLNPGESIQLKYRVFVHEGQIDIPELKNIYETFRRR